jgi:subtilisin family serine protease
LAGVALLSFGSDVAVNSSRVPPAALKGTAVQMRAGRIVAIVTFTMVAALVAAPARAQTGAGVRVYILDSGVRTTHEQFGGRVSLGPNFAGGANVDCAGHGTHVAGIVGGQTTGVAPGVAMISVRVLDCNLLGNLDGLLQAIQWTTQHYLANGGPAVAVLGLTTSAVPWSFNAIDNAIRTSTHSGLTWVTIAGNHGAWVFDYSPAREERAITVGAVNANNVRPVWSNFGPQVTLHSQGVDVISAHSDSDNTYAVASGTSMAAPRVAGYAARLLQLYPWAPAAHIKNLLVAQARPLMILVPPGTPNRVLP